MFANPRSFSQLTTSFFAHRSLGILRSPLSNFLLRNCSPLNINLTDPIILVFLLEINLIVIKLSLFSLPLYLSQNVKELTVFHQTGCKDSHIFINSKFFPKDLQNLHVELNKTGYLLYISIIIFGKKKN